MNKNYKLLIKTSIGVSLVILLVMQVELSSILGTFSQAILNYLLIGVIFFVIASVFEVLKLYSLLHREKTLFNIARLVFIGLFMNNFLPTNVGGDAYKVYMLNKGDANLGESVLPVLLDRVTGIYILLIAGLVYSLLMYNDLKARFSDLNIGFNYGENTTFLAIAIGVIIAMTIIASKYILVVKKLILRVKVILSQTITALRRVTKRDYMYLVLASVGFHLCRLFGFYYFILCFNGDILWHSLILVLMLVALISVLPISIGALGVREGVIVLCLNYFGIELSQAIAVSLMGLAVIWSKSLVGAGLFFFPHDTANAS